MCAACRALGKHAGVSRLKATAEYVAFRARFDEFSPRGRYMERRKCRAGIVLHVLHEGSFPTEPVTREAHPYLLPGDGLVRRVKVATQCGVAFLTVKSFYRIPVEQSSHELCSARGLCWRISGRFDLSGLGLACSRREDVVWSGGNVVWTPYFACFAKIQQMKREQFRTLQQGNLSVLEYQMRFMALSRTVEEAAQQVAILERIVRARQGQTQTGGLGRSRNSSKEAVVEAGNRAFSREVSSRVVATCH
ncbi:hypothetical protein Taro_043116 [Colocasia esculenta]|uniref:Retrotransposon gag domain-containing protein n=1 Tax=Colocasia esculenta TaxID=4460 RepID=A0A843WQK5_COLES|nr:hypothetical protein [Colocasia esculenta]